MEDKPLVSVCLPTYNGAFFLKEALDSLKNQTQQNMELIASDDASTDETFNILTKFAENVSFPCKVVRHEPDGIAENWNNTLKLANGKYIKFLFQDDVMYPDCIEKMVFVLEKDKGIGLVCSKRDIITDKDNRFTQGFIANFGNLQVNIPFRSNDLTVLKGKGILKSKYFKSKPINIIGEPIAVLFRTELISKIGYFRKDMFQLVDYEYWLRVFKKYKIAFMSEKLAAFRLHHNQASYKNNKSQLNDKELYYSLLYKDYFWYLHSDFKWWLFKKYNIVFIVYRNIKSLLKRSV
jgi:glycosyltransferase involved in cell wall biosynthesis